MKHIQRTPSFLLGYLAFLVAIPLTQVSTSLAESPFGEWEPAAGMKIERNTKIMNVHRNDSTGLTGYPNSNEKLSKYFPRVKDPTVIYLINKRVQKYEAGKYYLQYRMVIMDEKTPIHQSKYQRVTLNCQTKEYNTTGKEASGYIIRKPGEIYKLDEKSTFSMWANVICKGDSKFFKQLRRGYAF